MSGKSTGDLAELEFMARAHREGLTVSRPFGDNNKYDFIVDNKKKLLKVQIKGTGSHQIGSTGEKVYKLNVGSGCNNKKPYLREDVDFIICYLMEINAWYIIPVSFIDGMVRISLSPNFKESKYRQFRENWKLLF